MPLRAVSDMQRLRSNLSLRTLSFINFFLYEPQPTNILSANFIRCELLKYDLGSFESNLFRYEPQPLRTSAVANFITYERYPIITFAYEHLLTNSSHTNLMFTSFSPVTLPTRLFMEMFQTCPKRCIRTWANLIDTTRAFFRCRKGIKRLTTSPIQREAKN